MAIPKVFGKIPGLGKMGQAVKNGAKGFSQGWKEGYNSMSEMEQDAFVTAAVVTAGVGMGAYNAGKDD